MNINREEIIDDLNKRDALKLQKQLIVQRRIRMTIMSVLVSALCFTLIYGTLENPFQYTLSMIGNRFNIAYRAVFIVWTIVTGVAIQLSIVALMKLERYPKLTKSLKYVFVATVLLVLTGIIPALGKEYLFWHLMHDATAVGHALFILLTMYPFTNWVSQENPRLRNIIAIWQIVIFGGSLLSLIVLGMTAIFELWFFISLILFLLYISMTLFEEKIVKIGVKLMRDEENLNLGIEKYFIDLEKDNLEKIRNKKS